VGLELAEAAVVIRASASMFSGDLNAAKPGIMRAVENLASAISGNLGKALGVLGVGVGIWKIVGAFQEGVEKANEFNEANEKLEGVLANTGTAIGWNSEQLKKMAQDMSHTSTASITDITNGMAKLAIHQKISGENFQRTMQAALDMSPLFGGITSSAHMLGRALENPQHGMMVLRRLGIDITDSQKKLIKHLQESGQLAKAQGIILDLINGKVGGLAKKMTEGPTGRLLMARKELNDVIRDMGQLWIPMETGLTKMQTGFYSAVLSVAKNFATLGVLLNQTFSGVYDAIVGYIKPALDLVGNWTAKIVNSVVGNLDVMLGSWQGLGDGILNLWTQVTTTIQELWVEAGAQLAFGFSNLPLVFDSIAAQIQIIWNSMLASLSNAWDRWHHYLVSQPWYQEAAAGAAALVGGKELGDQTRRVMQDESRSDVEARARARNAANAEENRGLIERRDALGNKWEKSADKKSADEQIAALEKKRTDVAANWADDMTKLPRLSEKWKAAYNQAMDVLGMGKKPAIAGGPGQAELENRNLNWGMVKTEEFGKKIQDALLKQGTDAILKEQLGVQKDIGKGIENLVIQGNRPQEGVLQ
jgi:hypothetical protein